MESLPIGRWFRLRFPGTFARVIKYDPRSSHPYLVESMILRSRWWMDINGRPNNHTSPWAKSAPHI